ncbi:SLBB domain-containing protein [Devosia sp. YIM 151766]|uniref:polysaccharide biosynthesis/export family protein n=1 Tax=Devosia sp. YIM 151766 TaxID=3017325 RepID=UPI00255C92A3|nr:SLBB domain-containing protein [Devosia sp. YIM 151766]WIY54201.1 SLBB domain-containing protein [Devosia sp. YIM 151766]
MFIDRSTNFTAAAWRRSRRYRGALLAVVSFTSLCHLTGAGAAELWPQTKVRLTVIQWVPLKGGYERWDAFSGDFMISDDDTMPVPVIGQISTRDKNSEQMALEVATALKEQLGLVTAPETSIEIVSYPPVYVVGDVTSPGSFEFRQGMTVLQALALGGGERQKQTAGMTAERLRLASQLRSADDGLLLSRVRIARLMAEAGGAQEITFPKEVTGYPDAGMAQAAMKDEESIFFARQREVVRQTEALDDLIVLLNKEIETLRIRLSDVEQFLTKASEELSGVQSLVEKGLVTASRRSDLERQIADMRFDQLTQTTAILRAQQALSQAQREAAQLEDSSQTQAALAIQDEQAKIDQMLLQQWTSQRLLLDLDSDPVTTPGQPSGLHYSIVRQMGGATEIIADETTMLLPGDVLKVSKTAAVVPETTPDDLAQLPP